MTTARDICVAKHSVVLRTNCFNDPRNLPLKRAAAGLNPGFTGCPACHREAVNGVTPEQAAIEMANFMERLRGDC